VRFVVDGRKQTLVIPAGLRPPERRPMLVFLHGRGGSATSHLNDDFFAALAARGARAPVVVFPEGGDHSYWHDRRDGRWATYLMRDVVPAARRRAPVDPSRTALGGISMGGFGALDNARRNRGKLCAVGAHSPALFERWSETAPGAFDGPGDFARHDVVRAARRSPRSFAGQPIWIDSGRRDPFNPGIRAFVEGLRRGGVPVRLRFWPGGHVDSYWRRHWGSYLRFYAGALARCDRGG
jgi:S-formylglutathione hydrolase FrmB